VADGVKDESRMSSSVASDFEMPRASRRGAQKAAIITAKLLVTGGCFWYVSRQIEWSQVFSVIPLLDWRWAALAVLMAMLQIPLLGLRWRSIVGGLAPRDERMTRADMIAATAVGVFFTQVLPSVAGDGVRAWLLVRLGSNWRTAVTSVVIDRAVGVALLVVLGFVVLLLPSGFTALGGYRDLVLVVYGALILVGMVGLLLAPKIVPLLARWRYSRWVATLAVDVHRVLFGSKAPAILSIGCLVHAITVVIVWSVGRAQGLVLPLADAAVLFTVMIGVVIVPISIGGWGLRELAVISLLAGYGVAPERALLFSVCFGLALAVASLPGAAVWLLYPFAPRPRSDERREGEVRPAAGTPGAAPDIA
jgi:glycosyltransferase 2 family protein